MKLRTRLFVAFFCLAVVPLAGLVFYSYRTSMVAFRQAVETETALLAEGMERRLDATEERIRRRLAGFEAFTWESPDGARRILEGFDEEAPFLEEFEFIPAPPRPKDAPRDPDFEARSREEKRLRIQELSRNLLEQAERLAQQALSADQEAKAEAMRERAEAIIKAFAGMEEEAEETSVEVPDLDVSKESEMGFEIRRGEWVLGRFKARLKVQELVFSVLRETPRERGEIPFALGPQGERFYLGEDRQQLREVLTVDRETDELRVLDSDRWMVTTHEDEDTGVLFGVARPVGESLQQMRGSAVGNLMLGLGLIAVALIGILPVSRRITRELGTLADGARRVASGDWNTRVPVRSNDEIGALAVSFNRMAEQLSRHQEKLMAQERRRKEEEIERRVLAVEHRRQTEELEEARRFQLSLLPDQVPVVPGLDMAAFSRTATEVGGDYYDFQRDGDRLTVAMGDAVGHGARAGTLVAVIKSLFSSFAGRSSLTDFLAETSATLRRMGLDRSTMALSLVRLVPDASGWTATLAAAGMPPVYHYRAAAASMEEIALAGMPLGGILGFPYSQVERSLAPGDVVLLMSDGFAEAGDPAGQPLGYAAAAEHFRAAAHEVATSRDEAGSAQRILDVLVRATEAWTDGGALRDDVTFVVIRRVAMIPG